MAPSGELFGTDWNGSVHLGGARDQSMLDPVFRLLQLVKHESSSFYSFICSLVHSLIQQTVIEHILRSSHGQGAEDTLVSKS